MQIKDLKDKEKIEQIDLKIIWDQSTPEDKFGKRIKCVIVADAELESGPTAYLDLYNEDIDTLKFQDKIRIKDAYSKLVQNGKTPKQYRITNAQIVEKL